MDRVNGQDWIDIGGGKRGFRDRNDDAAVAGTEITAAWLNGVQEEAMCLIEKSGFTPEQAVNTLVARATRSLRLNLPVVGGTASVITLTLDPAPLSYAELNVLWVPLTANITGPTKINVNGLGERDLLRGDGSPTRDKDGVAGQVLTMLRNGNDWQIASITSANAPQRNVVRHVVAGVYSWVPPLGTWIANGNGNAGGGGGGGAAAAGGSGGGGGGGGYFEGWFGCIPGIAVPLTVGAAGSAGIGSGTVHGGAGGSTSIGSVMSATGGGGGITQSGTGGAGGSGSGGQINVTGGNGYAGSYIAGTSTPIGGNGAPSYRGSVIPAYVSGTSVQGFGAGVGGSGSGWTGAQTNGSLGAPGQITIWHN